MRIPSTPGLRLTVVLPHELYDMTHEQLIRVYRDHPALHRHIVLEMRLRGTAVWVIAGDLGCSKSVVYTIEYDERKRRAKSLDAAAPD